MIHGFIIIQGSYGGGIAVFSGSELNINNSKVIKNTASGNGGGIYIDESYNMTIDRCLFDGNFSEERGIFIQIHQRNTLY